MDQQVIYKETNECEDKQTKDTVLNMCKNAPIKTHGALRQPIIHITEYDDGDQGVVVEIESFPFNDSWAKSVYEFVGKLWAAFPSACLHLDKGHYRLDICTHACDAA